MHMTVYPSSRFTRRLKRLPHRIRERATARDLLFRANPFDPRLETHKLHGKQSEEWAYSVDYSYRVSFVFIGADAVLYTNIGTHDEVYR